MNKSVRFREGNRALNYALSRSPSEKTQNVIQVIPDLADGLYGFARDIARDFLQNSTAPMRRLANFFSRHAKETDLANSIYDLQLTAVFTTLTEYVGDNDIASVLVDALLYQATGLEAAAIPNRESLLLGSETIRGVHKYHIARQELKHIGDPEAWTFGKEYAAIVHNAPMDFAYIMSVAPLTLELRIKAQWLAKRILYGQEPTHEDQEKLRALLESARQGLGKMLESMQQTK